MLVWILAGPCLASASSSGRALAASVVFSFSCEFLIYVLLGALVSASRYGSALLFLLPTCTIKWFAVIPALFRVSSIAPYS